MPNHSAPSAAPIRPRRPALDGYLREARISFRRAGEALGWSGEHVRRFCLPFGDPKRKLPDAETAAAIEAWSGGRVPADSFAEPSPTDAEPPR